VTTFIVIGVIGLVVLGVSVVLGDLLDSAFNALTGDVFSAAVLGGFVAAFGFGGALVQGAGGPTFASVLVGGVAGVAAGAFATWLTRLVRSGSSDATLEPDDALGRSGRVISEIPDGGLGTVRVVIGGHSVQLSARAAQPIPSGTEIHVTEILSPTAVLVAPVWNELTDPSV
jgi:membrane-bound ClpP family serine protease